MRNLTISIIGLLLVATSASAARIYHCRDSDGTPRFTDTPCNAKTYTLRRLDDGSVDLRLRNQKTHRLLRAFEDERREREAEQQMVAVQEARVQRICERAQAQLQGLQEAGKVFRVNEKGEREVLSDQEHTAAIAAAKSDVQRYCAGE